MTQTQGRSEFTHKLITMLDRIEYRRIDNPEDMEDVARLRRKAYTSADILPVKGDLLIGDLDFDPQAYVFGVYYDEQLISTVRIHHVTPAHPVSSSGTIFPDAIKPMLDAGMSLIDPVRLAADPQILNKLPAISYLTLRIATMASDHFDVDRCVFLIESQQAALHRHVFRSDQVVAPTPNCDTYKIDLTLLASHVRSVRENIYKRLPFFQPQLSERHMMFAPPEELNLMPASILPKARQFL